MSAPAPIAAGSARRFGFTLIELLVAVAVTALLTAILLPSLARAREQARCLACRSNLAQIARAWHTYLNDHGGRFPKDHPGEQNTQINYGGKQGAGGPEYGADCARPVAKPLNRSCGLPAVTDRADVFCCPCDAGDVFAQGRCYDWYGTSYQMNWFLAGPAQWQPSSADPCKLVWRQMSPRLANLTWSNLATPSRLLLVGDFEWDRAWYFRTQASWYRDWHRRGRRVNVAFLDGRADLVRIRRGISVDASYVVVPFADLHTAIAECQREVP